MPCSVVSSFKLWPEEKTGPAARSTTQRVESPAAALRKWTLRIPSDGFCITRLASRLIHLRYKLAVRSTSFSSLLSAIIISNDSEFRVLGELRLICFAARPEEYEEVTWKHNGSRKSSTRGKLCWRRGGRGSLAEREKKLDKRGSIIFIRVRGTIRSEPGAGRRRRRRRRRGTGGKCADGTCFGPAGVAS